MKYELVNLDDPSVLAKRKLFNRQPVEKSGFKVVSFYCRHCEQYGLVHDDEVFDCHKGHVLDTVHTVHGRHSKWVRDGSVYFNVD